MRKLPALGFSLLVLGMGAGACGDSEKKKPGPQATGGSATAGSPSSGSGGASGNAAGTAGSAGANSAGSAGGGAAGAAGMATGGDAGGSGEGGSAGEGPEGGAGGEDPGPMMKATKLDVLFVIDNSISMSEKQTVLAQAVPTLVSRLVDPYCIYSDTTTVPATNGMCPPDSVREISPVRDMHVGVITSALGHRGGEVCIADPNEMPPRPLDDQAHLIGTVRTGLTSWNGSGFLKWDPAAQAVPPGEASAAALTSALQAMSAAAGDRGCGFEAPLEAMYRFLVDPEPPLTVSNDGAFTVLTGVDTAVLEQRAAFLRPDSALIVVLLSDEDDCSIVTEPNQQGWLVGRRLQMPRASASCANPNDPCCRPCAVPPATGCPTDAEDIECVKGVNLMPAEDSTNLRCYRQRQRFGIDLLYPVERYVTALTAAQVGNRSGQLVQNPLFTGSRTPQHVVFTTIVGVPWQDLVKETENFDGYEIMTAYELRVDGRFPIILGDYERGVPPTDPFMIDSIDPRSGRNPLTMQAIAPTTAANNATINGHEQNIVNRDDLQYACTFLLPQPIPCTTANQDGCDCNASEQAYSRPLCEYPGPGTEGTQTYAKAYPGRRELEVARRLRDQAVLASICPRSLADPMHPSYGYIPPMRALHRQVRRVLVP
jgi:hypothetical protein